MRTGKLALLRTKAGGRQRVVALLRSQARALEHVVEVKKTKNEGATRRAHQGRRSDAVPTCGTIAGLEYQYNGADTFGLR